MKIQILHPISYGENGQVITLGRGLAEVPDEQAKEFLALKDDHTGAPIAVPLSEAAPEQKSVKSVKPGKQGSAPAAK
jgi:hypothetical protein